MTALLVSIPAKADADRALFWAGLSGGLAVSLLLLIVQMLLDAWLSPDPAQRQRRNG